MQDAKDPKSTENVNADKGVDSKDPQSDAASADTLSDMDEVEKIPETDVGEANGNGSSSFPSPDGAFDEGRGGGGDVEDAGPI